jgi:hypothetical protein
MGILGYPTPRKVSASGRTTSSTLPTPFAAQRRTTTVDSANTPSQSRRAGSGRKRCVESPYLGSMHRLTRRLGLFARAPLPGAGDPSKGCAGVESRPLQFATESPFARRSRSSSGHPARPQHDVPVKSWPLLRCYCRRMGQAVDAAITPDLIQGNDCGTCGRTAQTAEQVSAGARLRVGITCVADPLCLGSPSR